MKGIPGRLGLRMSAVAEWAALQQQLLDADPLCRGDPRWTSDDALERQEAAQMCIGCPLIEQCRAFADENREEFAVWGGRDFTVTRRQITLRSPETDE